MEAYFSAIILMGGEGKRFSTAIPKQFHLLGGLSVYQHTLNTFRESGLFREIILVCHPDWIHKVQEESPDVKVVSGGNTRQKSSLRGLEACNPACNYVMIHDAVRPFVSHQILRDNIQAVLESDAVDTCIPSSDTIVMTQDGSSIASIPPRHQLWRGQTPQTFTYPLICEAHRNTTQTNATDDCQLIIDLGLRVAIVRGSEKNFKITTEWDLKMAHYFLEKALVF